MQGIGLDCLASIPAVITGHMAKREIRDAEGAVEGSGLASIGLIAGYTNIVVSVVALGALIYLTLAVS